MTHSYLGTATTVDSMCGQWSAQMPRDVSTPAPVHKPTGPSAAFLITTTRSVLPSGG